MKQFCPSTSVALGQDQSSVIKSLLSKCFFLWGKSEPRTPWVWTPDVWCVQIILHVLCASTHDAKCWSCVFFSCFYGSFGSWPWETHTRWALHSPQGERVSVALRKCSTAHFPVVLGFDIDDGTGHYKKRHQWTLHELRSLNIPSGTHLSLSPRSPSLHRSLSHRDIKCDKSNYHSPQ